MKCVRRDARVGQIAGVRTYLPQHEVDLIHPSFDLCSVWMEFTEALIGPRRSKEVTEHVEERLLCFGMRNGAEIVRQPALESFIVNRRPPVIEVRENVCQLMGATR